MIKIDDIEKESIAEELGLRVGDYLVSINRKIPKDRLDMIYFNSLEKLNIVVLDKYGVKTKYSIEKDADEKLGINLKGFDDMPPKWCANHCIFCFVDQLPKGLRKTLYVKDDDWRHSFATGSYVTLTNVDKNDIKRITSQKYSPLYVSVHATDQKTRLYMLGRKSAPNIMGLLKKFARAKIVVHTQAVVCPGINDGEILDKTIKDLSKLYPYVKSLDVVPVGLSGHRAKLQNIKPYDKQSARQTLELCNKWRNKCQKDFGDVFVYPSDELYLKAEMPFDNIVTYGEFEQIENGVGLLVKTESEFVDRLNELQADEKQRSFSIITGVSATPFMKKLAQMFMEKFIKSKIDVITIKNNFFGPTITVAGLVVGSDIIEQTKSIELNDVVVIPRVMMKETENVFLDGTTLDELKLALNRPIEVSGYLGGDLVDILYKGTKE